MLNFRHHILRLHIIKLATAAFIATLLTLTSIVMSSPVVQAAQYDQYLQRKTNLVSLAGIFGQLHHIRRTCNPRREANVWRERMQRMIKLEEPDQETHLQMVNAFNDGFNTARSTYPECNRTTQDKGKDLASQGNGLIEQLRAALQSETPPAVQ